jgi:hypothetical protein
MMRIRSLCSIKYSQAFTNLGTKISSGVSSIPLMILLRVTLSVTLVQGEGWVLTVKGETILNMAVGYSSCQEECIDTPIHSFHHIQHIDQRVH